MRRMLRRVPKKGLTPLKLEHVLIFLLGLALMFFGGEAYQACSSIGQIITLIIYLGLLVGVAPIQMPVVGSLFGQMFVTAGSSGGVDSYIVVKKCQEARTVEPGQDREAIMNLQEEQPMEGTRATLMALMTMAALIGGLVIWFGEVYAAGLYLIDNRTGLLSALYIVPPVSLFVSALGIHASLLRIEIVPNHAQKTSVRDLIEFGIGIVALLALHNPLACLGGLLVYAVITRQDDHLLDVWKHHTEVNVMLVLLIALIAGNWLVNHVITPLGLHEGKLAPIIPAGLQAVLWGPLYEDPSVSFWIRLTTLSTGALLFPISSLVGVMLFRTFRQWVLYCRLSIPYAILWYLIMRGWIWLTLESPIGRFLDQWAHSG